MRTSRCYSTLPLVGYSLGHPNVQQSYRLIRGTILSNHVVRNALMSTIARRNMPSLQACVMTSVIGFAMANLVFDLLDAALNSQIGLTE